MNCSGVITRRVVPSCHGVLSFSTTCLAAFHCTRSPVETRVHAMTITETVDPQAVCHTDLRSLHQPQFRGSHDNHAGDSHHDTLGVLEYGRYHA